MVGYEMSSGGLLSEARRRRLIIVSGKGGVGKTVVSVALGMAASLAGSRVLLVEVDPYGRMSSYLGSKPIGPEPVMIRPRLAAARIDSGCALEQFLAGLFRFQTLTKRLLASNTFRVVTAAAPGIDSFLTLRRITDWQTTRGRLGRAKPRFDLVVVDAPATGHTIPLLSTPAAILAMVPFGPLAGAARELALTLTDERRTAVLIVTRAEEVVINETIELVEAVSRLGMSLLPPIVNATIPIKFSPLEAARLSASPPQVPDEFVPFVDAARFHLSEQRRAEREMRRLKRVMQRKPILLPTLAPAGSEAEAAVELATALLGKNGKKR